MTTKRNPIRSWPDATRGFILNRLVALGLSVACLAGTASAATQYWDTNGPTAGAGGSTPTGTWGIDNYWSTSSAGTAATGGWGSGNAAIFSAGTDATGTFSIAVDSTQTASSLTFEEGTVSLSGGTITLSGAGAGVAVNAGRVAAIGSVIAGSSGVLKTGAGELILSGANTFTGNLTNRAGVVTFSHNQSASTGIIVVDNTAPVVLHNSQPLTTLTNNILLRASGSTVDVAVDSGTTFELTGVISGSHPWSAIGLGTIKLGGVSANTYVGALAIAQGTVIVAKDVALGSIINGTVVSNNATLAFSGGFEYTANEVITLNGTGVSGGAALNNLSDDNAFDGTVALAANSSIGASSGSLAFNGPITGSFNVTKVGGGQVDLFALNNTYLDTHVSTGTFGVWYPSGAGTGLVTVDAGAKLAGNGFVPGGVDLSGTIEPGVGVDILDTGDQTWQENAQYNWDISDASGFAGMPPGWDLLNINGGLESLATASDPFTIHIRSLEPSFETPGDAANFNNALDYAWPIAATTGGVDVDLSGFVVDDSNFSNEKGFGFFMVDTANSGNDLVVRFVHPPYITLQPTNTSGQCSSGTASFSVGAAGTGILSYQWLSNGIPLVDDAHFSGVSTPTLTITTPVPADAPGNYSCAITGDFGSTNSAVAQLTVIDTIVPTITFCPANTNKEFCDSLLPANTGGSATATDGCDPSPVISYEDVITPGSCVGNFTITRTWKAKDAANNEATCVQTITVQDTTNPSITCVANKTVQCGDSWTFDEPSSSDGCGFTTNLVLTTITNAPPCGNTFTAIRTWQATDACGNLSPTCSQTVTVVDTNPPVIVCVPNKSVETGASWTFDLPAVSDECGAATLSVVSTITNGTCGKTFVATRTWKATDACGNESTNCSQVVTVEDTTAPTIVCAPNKTVECTSAWTFDAPHAADGGLWASVVYNNSVNDMLARFVAGTNEVGNEIIIGESARYLTSFSFEYWGTNASAGGNPPFAGSVQVRLRMYANDGTLYSGYPSPGTLLYDSGNFPVTVTDRSIITYDELDLWVNGLVPLTGPVPTNFTWTVQFTGLGPDDQVGVDLFEPPVVGQAYGDYWIKNNLGNWELQDSNVVEYDFAALANAGTNVVAIAVLDTVTNSTCGNAFTATRTWVATDACGNTNTCSQTVTVQDTTPPTISCPITVITNADPGVCYASGVVLGTPVTSDTCGTVTATNDAPLLMPKGTNSVVWTAFDACGNSTTCTQTVVVLDLELPTITCPPALTDVPTDLNLCSASGVILGAPVATNDNCGILIVTNNAPAVFPHGTTVVQWTVVDTSGNVNVCNQSVTVQDHQAPLITCVPNKTAEYTDSWTFDGPSASDNCDVPVISVLSTVTNGLCGKTYSATRTWVAVDTSGNSNTCSQVVTVVDTTAPVIVCAPDKSVECTSAWTFDVPHAADGGLWTSVVYDNSVNDTLTRFVAGTNEVGNEIIIGESARYLTSFSFEYWGTNASAGGNPPFGGSVQVRLRLYANDGVPFSGYPSPGTLLYDSGNSPVSVTPRSVVTYDEFDLWVNGLVPLSGAVPTNFTWTVQFSGLGPDDQVGVDLFEPPVVGQAFGDYWIKTNGTWELRDNISVEYDYAALANAGTNAVTIAVLSTVTNLTCGNAFTAARAWLATDACGNTSTCTQIVSVVDTTAPTISCPTTVTVPAALGLCYATNVSLGTPVAADTCGIVTLVNNAPLTFPVGSNVVVWTATDECGNSNSCLQTVIVEDTQPPILTAGSIDPCYTSATLAEAAAIAATSYAENCSVTNISAVTVGTCSATVTVTITDASGLSDSVNYSTRIDNTAPVIGAITVTQTQGGGPVNVKDQTCAVAPVLQGVVVITVDASDDCSLVNGKPVVTLTNGVNVAVATCVATNINTFTFEWTVNNTTAGGVWYATVGASDLCNSTTANFTVCVNQSQITGLLQLEGFVGTGTNVNHSRVVTFVLTGGTTVTNTLSLTNVSGDTFSYTLVSVPAGTTGVSAKTAWNLREKLAVVFDVNNQAVANFTGNPLDGWSDASDHYLRGGDLNGNNQVSFNDYSILGNNYFTFTTTADITGNGIVNLGDYNILSANWFSAGDPQ